MQGRKNSRMTSSNQHESNAQPPSTVVATSTADQHPSAPSLAEVLTSLPQLKTTSSGNVDFAASDLIVLAHIAGSAASSSKVLLGGIAAIGSLLAHAGPEIEDGTVNPATIEAVGLLLADLGVVSGMLVSLEACCQQAVRDAGLAEA